VCDGRGLGTVGERLTPQRPLIGGRLTPQRPLIGGRLTPQRPGLSLSVCMLLCVERVLRRERDQIGTTWSLRAVRVCTHINRIG